MKTRLFNYVITLGLVVFAGWAAFSLYHRYIQNPWTRDSQVRANIVGIAPRVSGPIVQVAVHDNQEVKKEICYSRSIQPISKPSSTSPPVKFKMLKRTLNNNSKILIDKPIFIKRALTP